MRWAHCPAAWPQLLVVHETAAAVLAQRPAGRAGFLGAVLSLGTPIGI